MVVSFICGLEADTGELKEVVLDDTATDLVVPVEAHLDEFTESGAVVVTDCLSIT